MTYRLFIQNKFEALIATSATLCSLFAQILTLPETEICSKKMNLWYSTERPPPPPLSDAESAQYDGRCLKIFRRLQLVTILGLPVTRLAPRVFERLLGFRKICVPPIIITLTGTKCPNLWKQ